MQRQAWMTAQQEVASDFSGTFSLGRTTAGLSLMLCPLQCTEAGMVSIAVTETIATISFMAAENESAATLFCMYRVRNLD